MAGRSVLLGPVGSEMTPTIGAACVVTLGKSNHVLLSRRSLFRCVVYALRRLREALSVNMKNNKFCTFSTLFLWPVRPRHEIYLWRRCLKNINTGTNLFSSQSKLGCRPQDFARKFTFTLHLKGAGIHVKNLTKKTRIRLIAWDVFAVLSLVVAKGPYIHERDSSILALLETRMIKCGKVSGFVGKIVFTTNVANLKGIWFTWNFWFKISRDLRLFIWD